MTTPSPEETGRQLAEALVASLDSLKQRVGGPAPDLGQDQRAGLLAVEALKALLPEVTDELGAGG